MHLDHPTPLDNGLATLGREVGGVLQILVVWPKGGPVVGYHIIEGGQSSGVTVARREKLVVHGEIRDP